MHGWKAERFSQAAPLVCAGPAGDAREMPGKSTSGTTKKVAFSHLRLSKNPGVDQGPQPLMFHPALTTQGELPRRGKRRPPGGVCVRTDKNPEGFVLCRFCRPGAMREAKPVKVRKSGVQPLFRHSEVAFSHFFICNNPLGGRGRSPGRLASGF